MPTKPSKKPSPLPKDSTSTDILVAEYNYIAGTADQANEDRSRISSFFLIAVGSLIAALSSAKFLTEMFKPNTVNILYSALFFLLTLLGFSTILQLIRLRVAWFESVLAMNHIKEFLIAKDNKLANAFKWRSNTLPSFFKVKSIAFLQTMEVAFISSLTFGAGVFFFQKSIRYDCLKYNLEIAASCGFLALLFLIWNYRRVLNDERNRLQKELEVVHVS